jgi:acetyl esterase
LRARSAARQASFKTKPVSGVLAENLQWKKSEGDLFARIYHPEVSKPDHTLAMFYFHGGGFVSGGLNAVDHQCRLICKAAGISVISFAYSLAPENPFPAAIEDAIAAIAWGRDHLAGKYGLPPRIVVAGDSAGANLAAVAAQSLARYSLRNVIGQFLVYPVLDLKNESWSYAEHSVTPTLTAERMRWYANLYATKTGRSDLRISPGLTSDLTGVAPALIISAEIDPLLGEAQDYANTLRQQGIAVEHYVFRGLYHGFWNWGEHHTAVQHAACIAVGWLDQMRRADCD